MKASEIKIHNIIIINGRYEEVVISKKDNIINLSDESKLIIEFTPNNTCDHFIWINKNGIVKCKNAVIEKQI